ncbi:MAG: hypothetical protein ACP5NL_03375 [Thermoplasmata archaeon]
MNYILLFASIFGFAISIFSTILLSVAFNKLKRRPFYILLSTYLFFSLSFLFSLLSYFYSYDFLVFSTIFETLAFFVIYIQYFKKEIILAALPLMIVYNLLLVLSLYFLVYNSIIILKQKNKEFYSLVVFSSFLLFIFSVGLSMFNVVVNNGILQILSMLFLSAGVIMFFVPLYIVLLRGANEKKQD